MAKRHDPAPLLLAARLAPEEVAAHLAPYGLTDFKRADANLQAMAGEPRSRALLAGVLGELLSAVSETADPDQALTHWEQFTAVAGNRVPLFEFLRDSLRTLHLLSCIFGNSPALAQTLIRDPLQIYRLADEPLLKSAPSRAALRRALTAAVRNVTALELKLEALRRFRRREMLRIGVRDLLHVATVTETATALSDLAAVLIHGAYEIVSADLRARHGVPRHRDRRGTLVETGFAVIAMGKLGGHELNYSSDVDLLFVYASEDGATRPPKGGRSIPNEEYFEYLARALTAALAERTQEGYVYRVDLRLRPEGQVGALAKSLAAYEQYYRTRGRMWERQALLKASPIAGDAPVGRAFLRLAARVTYGGTPLGSAEVLEEVKSVKAMIDEKMADRGHQRTNVKLGIGGIREIEFIVQAIQLMRGGAKPALRERNTLGALERVRRARVLSGRDADALARAYRFLRDVEHKLQMVHDLQTHALPASLEELTRCAVRMGYRGKNREQIRERFLRDVERETGTVNRLFRSVFRAAADA